MVPRVLGLVRGALRFQAGGSPSWAGTRDGVGWEADPDAHVADTL